MSFSPSLGGHEWTRFRVVCSFSLGFIGEHACVELHFFPSFFFFARCVPADTRLLLCTVPCDLVLLLLCAPLDLAAHSCARGNSPRRGDTGGVFFEHGGDKEGREEGEKERNTTLFGVAVQHIRRFQI